MTRLLTIVAAIASLSSIQQGPVPVLDVAQFQARYQQANDWEREFIDSVLFLYRRFRSTLPDTTRFVLGDIDGNGQVDTLYTRVTMVGDTVHSFSWWDRNGERLWEYNYSDPYMYIGEPDELYAYGMRSPWVTFTIGIKRPSKLRTRDSLIPLGINPLRQAMWHFDRLGIHVSEDEYAEYLHRFSGMAISFGQPESEQDAYYIWYEPLRRFIAYHIP